MILMYHKSGVHVVEVFHNHEQVPFEGSNCTDVFWSLANQYPNEIICWCEITLKDYLVIENLKEVFHHDLIMASYSFQTDFLPESIGYVDQLPFANVNRTVLYATWKMSRDMGGIKGAVIMQFKNEMSKIKNFEFLLNSIAKVGQQNSLFCYSAPQLCKAGASSLKIFYTASTKQLFQFVFAHYSTVWTSILLLCLTYYEKKIPLLSYVGGFFNKKLFRKSIDLSAIKVLSSREFLVPFDVEVIIPTIGRANYLREVIQDFSKQTILPSKIIIVEQSPNKETDTELSFLEEHDWPFEIVHHFIHKTGACNARNLALSETTAEWIFFSDDDQRFDEDLIEKVFREIKSYGLDCLTTSYLQINEKKFFKLPKQWGTFGAGNSLVRGTFARSVRFSPVFEHGYGEDADFGRQLKNMGCDIVYHPDLEIKHLKAPVGGFRKKNKQPWEEEEILPKPSPTVMAHALKHYTEEQILGYKVSLILRFYRHQSEKNPFFYLKQLNRRWTISKRWAGRLLEKEKTGEICS